MSVQSVSKSAKRPSKPVVTKVNGSKKKPATKKPVKKAKDSSPSPSKAIVQIAVRNLGADADAIVAKCKAKGIKADEARVRSIFARCKFIIGEFKAAH